jgi:hypothetical protein
VGLGGLLLLGALAGLLAVGSGLFGLLGGACISGLLVLGGLVGVLGL